MKLSITDKIVGFITRPAETFRAVREETFGIAITYFGALLIVNAVLSAIVGYFGFGIGAGMPGSGIAGASGLGAMVTALIFALIAGIIGLAIGSILLHIGVIVMGGRGGFMQTFKAVIYGQTPYYLLGWIPIVGLIAGIWGLVVEIFGIRELHDMTTGRAVFAWLISLIIVLIIVAVLVVILGALLFTVFGIASSSGAIPAVTISP